MMARPTTVTNIRPTRTAVIFSKVAYLPNQTMTKPARPITMAQAHSGRNGKTAASGRARGRHGRGAVDEAPDHDVRTEVPGGPAAQGTPAFEDGLAGGEREAAGTFNQDDLQDDAEDDCPQQAVAVAGTGHQGGDHVGRANTRGRNHESGANNFPFGSLAAVIVNPLRMRYRIRAGSVFSHRPRIPNLRVSAAPRQHAAVCPASPGTMNSLTRGCAQPNFREWTDRMRTTGHKRLRFRGHHREIAVDGRCGEPGPEGAADVLRRRRPAAFATAGRPRGPPEGCSRQNGRTVPRASPARLIQVPPRSARRQRRADGCGCGGNSTTAAVRGPAADLRQDGGIQQQARGTAHAAAAGSPSRKSTKASPDADQGLIVLQADCVQETVNRRRGCRSIHGVRRRAPVLSACSCLAPVAPEGECRPLLHPNHPTSVGLVCGQVGAWRPQFLKLLGV